MNTKSKNFIMDILLVIILESIIILPILLCIFLPIPNKLPLWIYKNGKINKYYFIIDKQVETTSDWNILSRFLTTLSNSVAIYFQLIIYVLLLLTSWFPNYILYILLVILICFLIYLIKKE